MGKRYQAEERNKEREPEQKAEQGKRLSPPLPDDLHAWFQASARLVPWESLTAKAIQSA